MKCEKHIEVTIRPLRLSDAAAVQSYASDERVARTTNIPQPYPEIDYPLLYRLATVIAA